MIVVYDLRHATDHFPGIGTHAWELFHALLALPGPERYRALWNHGHENGRFDVEVLRSHPRVELVESDIPPLAWDTASRTGALLRRLGGDVYFSPFSLRPDGGAMPDVLTLHDVLPLAPEGGARWWRRMLFAAALRGTARARAVLTSSEFSRSDIAGRTAIPDSIVRVVRLGITTPPVGGPLRPAALPSGPFALCVGINKPHKNLATLAGAWRGFRGAPPLTLAGVGPSDPRFKGWVGYASEIPGIAALGRVSPLELEWLYRHATLVLFPSRYEGFGFPLLEALSRGAPAVCSDIPALRELGADAARFVSALDVDAWAEAVRELAADEAARERYRRMGVERSAAFGYEICAGRTLAILREVAGKAA